MLKPPHLSVPRCPRGSGGLGCTPCEYGSYSSGGTVDEPFRPCSRCPTGSYTSSLGATSKSDCFSVIVSTCSPGYVSQAGACHKCPTATYSPGGAASRCIRCPDGTTTKDSGSGDISACIIPSGEFDASGSWSWTSNLQSLFSERCRNDLAKLFTSADWDRRLGAEIRYDKQSCSASDEGFDEIQVRRPPGGKGAGAWLFPESLNTLSALYPCPSNPCPSFFPK